MHVVKKDQEADHWCRLTNDKVFEKRHVATDWSRYVDEDEEDDAGAFDMSALQGADSFAPASAVAQDEPDSDDDDVDLSDLDGGLERLTMQTNKLATRGTIGTAPGRGARVCPKLATRTDASVIFATTAPSPVGWVH